MAQHVKLMETEVSKSLVEIEADWAKCAEDAKVTKKAKEPIFETILGYTDQKIILAGKQVTIRRVFVRTLDSDDYYKLGWVVKPDVDNCMICTTDLIKESGLLDFLDWSSKDVEKKHCFACGNIVCSDCSSNNTIVREIAKLGPVNVCTQCTWGQDEVGITVMPQPPTYKIHLKIQAAIGASPTKATHSARATTGANGSVDVSSKGKEVVDLSVPRIWKYGNVRVDKITPVFSFEARNKDKAIVYINLCTCPLVPFNLHPESPQKRNNLLAKKNQELMFVVGDKGISASTEGAFVFDVVVHPAIIPLCNADATGVLKEKVCAEVLRGIRRMGIESEFVLFSYRPANIVYNQRHFTYAEKLASSGDYEIWKQENKLKAQQAAASGAAIIKTPTAKKLDVGTFADIEEEEEDQAERERIIFSPIPSISAFFHMEQIAVSRNDLKRPPGVHDKRWSKYDEIVQVADGSVYIPNNKRAKKVPPIIQHISQPVLLQETINEKQLDRYGNKLTTYTMSLLALNGFVINAPRVHNTAVFSSAPVSKAAAAAAAAEAKEEVLVHVLHHPFVDDFTRSGILEKPYDDLDPLLLLCKKSFKVKKENGTTCRAYNVVVGSSYIVGVDDLTGRRIVTPERITKILRRVNAMFEDTIDPAKYVLTGIDKRPTNDLAQVTLYSYERPLFGSVEEVYVPPVVPVAPTPSAKPSHKQKAAPSMRVTISRDDSASSSVLSDLTNNEAHLLPGGAASMSRDSGPDSPRSSPAPAMAVPPAAPSPSGKKSGLRFLFGSGSRSASNTTSAQVTPSTSHAQLSTQPSEEFKGDTNHGHGHTSMPKPAPSPAHRSTMALPAAGIASLDDGSVHSSTGSIHGHGHSPDAGLGLGAARGLTLEVLVAQTKSQSRSRNSIGSRNSDTSSIQSGDVEPAPAQTIAPQRSIFLNQPPTPLHREASSPQGAGASQTPHTAPDSGRQASQGYTGRPFSGMFFRDSSDRRPLSASVSRTTSSGPGDQPSPAPQASAPSSLHREAGTTLTSLHASSSGSAPATPAAVTPVAASTAPATLGSSSTTPRTTSGLTAVKTLSRKKSALDMHGRELVTEDMLEYVAQASVNRAVSEGLSKQSVKDPKILFGWQIRINDHMQGPTKGLYVITAVKRSVIGIYDFRVTNLHSQDQWVKLKRGGQGEGLAFSAIRKVLTIEE